MPVYQCIVNQNKETKRNTECPLWHPSKEVMEGGGAALVTYGIAPVSQKISQQGCQVGGKADVNDLGDDIGVVN